MRFYIAARFKKTEMVKEVQQKLRTLGHEITNDWTGQDSIKPYEQHIEQARIYTEQDLEGIRRADVLILFSEKQPDARSSHIELGYAFALWETHKKPRIYIIDESGDPALFFFHPGARMKNNLEEILLDLKTDPLL